MASVQSDDMLHSEILHASLDHTAEVISISTELPWDVVEISIWTRELLTAKVERRGMS